MSCVLVVEDDLWIEWMIADDLADRGHAVLTAHDGVEALECMREIRPDVIVLDLMLPRLDGWELVDRYQAVTGGAVVPIVVVTAARNPDLPDASHGVRRCLPKPFDIEELARAVAQLAGPQAEGPPAQVNSETPTLPLRSAVTSSAMRLGRPPSGKQPSAES